jgi:histidinol phosphatase-like PHP family hydrolase
MTRLTDINAVAGGLLMDLALASTVKQSEMGYQRAAKTVLALEERLDALVAPDGSLRKIQNVGPKSERVLLEVLASGESPTAEQIVASSEKAEVIRALRAARATYLSRSRVLEILRDASLSGPSLEQYHGDLQVHSTWSDGSQSLREIVATGLDRGCRFAGVTDHWRGQGIPRGLTAENLAAQQSEIDQVNAEFAGAFRLIKAVEANITPDGTVDAAAALGRFELALAAPHWALRSPEDQTGRMIAAVTTPGVHVLAHPRGRVFSKRGGITVQWDDVFDIAARAGVAIEIDGDPARQDIDYALAGRALEAGCIFSLDSDAHAPWEFVGAEFAVAHARLAGIPAERIINCWPTEKLLDWAAERRAR